NNHIFDNSNPRYWGRYFHDRCKSGGQTRWIIYQPDQEGRFIDAFWHPLNYHDYETTGVNVTQLLKYLSDLCPFNLTQLQAPLERYAIDWNTSNQPSDFRIVTSSPSNESICSLVSHFRPRIMMSEMHFDFTNFSRDCAFDLYTKE